LFLRWFFNIVHVVVKYILGSLPTINKKLSDLETQMVRSGVQGCQIFLGT
jgi:hypothetical protein